MSFVRGLVLLHLSATALLLVAFVTVMACQRLAELLRQQRLTRRARVAVPAQAAGTSVLDWTIDLRSPAPAESSAAVLQRTS